MATLLRPSLASTEIQEKPNFKITRHRLLIFLLLMSVLTVGFSLLSVSKSRFLRAGGVLGLIPELMEPISLNLWIRPPRSLTHDMTDEELLWRASIVPQRKNYPFKRTLKIALMFLTKGPLPLYPLWEKFFEGHEMFYSIYIHSTPSYQAGFPKSSPFYGRQIPSQIVEWGKMSICDAERRLLANALLDFSNEWFVLLSETCIPLVKFSEVHSYITQSKQSFLDAFDDLGVYGRGRYNPNMKPEINLTDWRKGSQWFQVDRVAAVAIVKDEIFYPKFKEFCQPACYVDEHYFPTMLTIEMADRLANRSLTWVDWSRGGFHPATFGGGGDVAEGLLKSILQGQSCLYNGQPSSRCHLFARKFSPGALSSLLELAPRVLGYG
ncbi:glycosyltransferase BC10-like [Wolffia australiana]